MCKWFLISITLLPIPSNFAPENLDSMENALAVLNHTSNQVSIEGALRTIYAINHRSNYLGDLQTVQFPILIVIGKYDNVYGAEEQHNDARQILKAEVLMLQHSGHFGFLEEEDLVVKKLSAFLESKLSLNLQQISEFFHLNYFPSSNPGNSSFFYFFVTYFFNCQIVTTSN